MALLSQVLTAGSGRNPLLWPFLISFLGHGLLLGFVIYTPDWEPKGSFMPSVIDVQMVDLAETMPATRTAPKEASKAPPVVKPKPAKPKAPVVETKAAAKPEVSVAPPSKKTKTALKYKTFKSKEVLQKALQQLEQKVDTAPPRPLADTIKQLEEQVAKEGPPSTVAKPVPAGSSGSKTGIFSRGSKQEIELIDLYRLEIAFQVNKNWAFAQQLASGTGNLVASIVFKVMPDGSIEDIFFTDRSGNSYLDDSAYKAIVKSSPVKPHPEGLARAYIEMGLRFTPEGVR